MRIQDDPFPDAERSLVWADACSYLRLALDQRNPYATHCLDGWRNGEKEHETAAALGISREYVKKLRRLIRTTASEIFSGEGWVQ